MDVNLSGRILQYERYFRSLLLSGMFSGLGRVVSLLWTDLTGNFKKWILITLGILYLCRLFLV
jgi:hypothetical protein